MPPLPLTPKKKRLEKSHKKLTKSFSKKIISKTCKDYEILPNSLQQVFKPSSSCPKLNLLYNNQQYEGKNIHNISRVLLQGINGKDFYTF